MLVQNLKKIPQSVLEISHSRDGCTFGDSAAVKHAEGSLISASIGQKEIKMAPQCLSPYITTSPETFNWSLICDQCRARTLFSAWCDFCRSDYAEIFFFFSFFLFLLPGTWAVRLHCRLQIMGHTLWHSGRWGSIWGSLPERTEATTGQVMMEADGRDSNRRSADGARF